MRVRVRPRAADPRLKQRVKQVRGGGARGEARGPRGKMAARGGVRQHSAAPGVCPARRFIEQKESTSCGALRRGARSGGFSVPKGSGPGGLIQQVFNQLGVRSSEVEGPGFAP